MLRRLPIVAVLGQGSTIPPDRAQLARQTGGLVARLGGHLLTGAGYGVMEAAAEGFVSVKERIGLSIGIVPRDPAGPLERPNRDALGRPYPNRFVEIVIQTPLPPRTADWLNEPSRNHVNVFSADAIIALPGAAGTQHELALAAHYRGEAERPREQRRTILLGPQADFAPIHHELFLHTESLPEAERHLRRILETQGHRLAGGARREHAVG